jgi:Zn-dependent membrane protease YugP
LVDIRDIFYFNFDCGKQTKIQIQGIFKTYCQRQSDEEVSALVPLQNISATILNMIFIGMFFGSFLLGSLFSMQTALLIIVACYGVFTLFAFITLPVEFDASSRALDGFNVPE